MRELFLRGWRLLLNKNKFNCRLNHHFYYVFDLGRWLFQLTIHIKHTVQLAVILFASEKNTSNNLK